MRFRLGLMMGFGAGYYLGAMAGRERYEQINQLLKRAKESETFEVATEKTKAVVDLGVERAKDFVEEHTDSGTNGVDLETSTMEPGTPYRTT